MTTSPTVELEALVQAALHVNSSQDTATMARHILEEACRVLATEAASLMLVDEADGTLKFLAALGVAGRGLQEQDVLPGEGIAGWVARTAEPVMSNDVAGDPRFARRFDALSGFVTRSLLCVPLVARGRVLGVLELINRPPDRPFAPDDLLKAKALASLSAVALDYGRLARLAEGASDAREVGRLQAEAATVVADELRNPLTAIRGFAEALQDEALDAERMRRFAAGIGAEAQRMERLVEGFLELSRGQAAPTGGHEDTVALAALASEAAARVQTPRHPITVEVPADAVALADAERLGRVLDHLLRNAVRFSPDGGPIAVRAERSGGCWRVSVADRGVGVPEECRSRLFHPFYRVPHAGIASRQGAGLGLTTVKVLVHRMGGRTGCESEPGRGSTFWLEVPSATEPVGKLGTPTNSRATGSWDL